jgi:hypothetical protein
VPSTEKLRPVGLVFTVTVTIAGVGVGVDVGVGVAATAEGLPSMIRPHAAAAKHAITMSRLIPSINAWRSRLKGSCTLEEDKGLSCMDDIRCELSSPWRRKALRIHHRRRSPRMLLRLLRNQVPEKKTFFDSRRFKNCPAVWKWSDFDDCHRNSACFLQKPAFI